MRAPFNGLTPAEAERLAMLAEEATEIAHAAMKALRHGYENYSPVDRSKTTNRVLLHREMTDLRAVWELMLASGDQESMSLHDVGEAKLRKLKYAHHQGDPA